MKFSFKETEPNLKTMQSRFMYFFGVTNPKNFMVSDVEIKAGVDTVNKYKEMAAKSEDQTIEITLAEREQILRGVELMNSSTNDTGELVFKPFRMCGFVPVNIPILCGIVLSSPTMFNTIFFQWLNQSYNAGLNFGNKNSTCEYTNTDLLGGYLAAVGSSISVAVTLRKLTAGMTATATGKKLLLLNTIVGGTAGGCASFCNTFFMRMAETQKGIDVFKDEELTEKAGVSKKCAESAVIETAMSRSAMSLISVFTPCTMILTLGMMGVRPKSSSIKTLLEVNCIALALLIGLPASVAIFPPVS